MLKTNVGGIDRVLRLVVGVLLLAWFFLAPGEGFWHYAKLIGIVPILTAVMSTCPIYTVLGLSTCPMKQT
jgi:hypothetical protein